MKRSSRVLVLGLAVIGLVFAVREALGDRFISGIVWPEPAVVTIAAAADPVAAVEPAAPTVAAPAVVAGKRACVQPARAVR